jgi:hypothetical protein
MVSRSRSSFAQAANGECQSHDFVHICAIPSLDSDVNDILYEKALIKMMFVSGGILKRLICG